MAILITGMFGPSGGAGSFKLYDPADIATGTLNAIVALGTGSRISAGGLAGEIIPQTKSGAPTHSASVGTLCWDTTGTTLYVNSSGSTTWTSISGGGGGGSYQPLDNTLTSLSALGTVADRYAYTTGLDTWVEGTITAAGRDLLDDTDAATQRTTLGLGNVENTALSSWAGSTNLAIVGTIHTGTWHAAAIAADSGGTGQTSWTAGDLLYATGTTALSKLGIGASGRILQSTGSAPSWVAVSADATIASGGALTLASILTAGSQGSASVVPVITWDAKGRLTVVSSATITPAAIGAATSGHTHAGVYEPVISTGTTAQYYRGDKAWQTLDKAAVGLANVENTALSTWGGSTNLTTLGAATATSINKVTITAPATSATLTIANGKTLFVNNTMTLSGTDSIAVAFGGGGSVAYTGHGHVWADVNKGTSSLGDLTTRSASDINAGTLSTAYFSAWDDLVADARLGTTHTQVAYGDHDHTSINKLSITAPATSATLAVANTKTFTVSNTLTFTGTDGVSVAFPSNGTVSYEGHTHGGGGGSGAADTVKISTTTGAQYLVLSPSTGGSYYALNGDAGLTYDATTDLLTTAGRIVAGAAATSTTGSPSVSAITKTWNHTNLVGVGIGGAIGFTNDGTIEDQTIGIFYGMVNNVTIRRTTNPGAFTLVGTLADFPTFIADGVPITAGGGVTLLVRPTLNTANGGTLTLDTHTIVDSDIFTISAGTLTTRRGLRMVDASGAGTLVNQVVVDVPSLLKGTTLNCALRSAIAAATTRNWHLYCSGTAPSCHAGLLRVGDSGTAPTAALDLASAQANHLRMAGYAGNPSSVTAGDHWYNTTQKSHRFGSTLGTQGLVGLFYTATAASSAIANSTAETTFSNASFAIPANGLTTGKVLRIHAGGVYGTNSTPTLTVRIRYGSGGPILWTTAYTSGGTGSSKGWALNAMIVIRISGVSGTAAGTGVSHYDLTSTTVKTDVSSVVNGVTINTTSGASLILTVQWGTAHANNTITCYTCTMEALD